MEDSPAAYTLTSVETVPQPHLVSMPIDNVSPLSRELEIYFKSKENYFKSRGMDTVSREYFRVTPTRQSIKEAEEHIIELTRALNALPGKSYGEGRDTLEWGINLINSWIEAVKDVIE